MNAKSKELIEVLESIVMDLHRSASQLDNTIQSIKDTCDIHDVEFMLMSVKQHYRFRNDYKKYRQYDTIDEREIDIWNQLIESLKEGNS